MVRARRAWKRLNDKDATGRWAIVARLLRAFKMGIYFKVLITLTLLFRVASHSSQMTFPNAAMGVDEYYASVAGASRSPTLRLIVVADRVSADSLQTLLASLDSADYITGTGVADGGRPSIALDVWLFASSTANALPMVMYPLALALFGPPRFDHSLASVAHAFPWSHGRKSIVAVRSEPNWAITWPLHLATSRETIVFFDASRAKAVSPWYSYWLGRARTARADAAVYALDGLTFPSWPSAAATHATGSMAEESDVGTTADADLGSAVLTEAFFPGTAVFSPTSDAWTTFLEWHALRKRVWFRHPSIPGRMRVGHYDRWEALRVDPVRAWFTQFLLEYRGRVVHPVLRDSQVLVARHTGTTDPSVAFGTGLTTLESGLPGVHLSADAEVRANVYADGADALRFRRQGDYVVVKWDGSRTRANAPFGMRDLFDSKQGHAFPHRFLNKHHTGFDPLVELLTGDALAAHRSLVAKIASYGHGRGNSAVSITLTNAADLEMTLNWLCNVAALDIVPPALVVMAADEAIASVVTRFISSIPTRNKGTGALVLAMDHTKRMTLGESASAAVADRGEASALDLGVRFVVRDLVDLGVGVLTFGTNEVWFSNPLPYVDEATVLSSFQGGARGEVGQGDVTGRPADLFVAVSSAGRTSSDFVYLRPSLKTRRFWSELAAEGVDVCHRVQAGGSTAGLETPSMQRANAYVLEMKSRFITHVEDALRVRRRAQPSIKSSVLTQDLFVDGSWYLDFEDPNGDPVAVRTHYTSDASRQPVVLRSNLAEDANARKLRAQRFRHWFISGTQVCDVRSARSLTPSRQ